MRYVEKNPPLATKMLKTKAGDDGRWSVQFTAASFQPTWIIAQAAQELAVVNNVLIGEIWVCAGQSMGWGNLNRKGREAASADFPGLRYIAWRILVQATSRCTHDHPLAGMLAGGRSAVFCRTLLAWRIFASVSKGAVESSMRAAAHLVRRVYVTVGWHR